MRLKIKNLNRLIKDNLTNSEISLYIYIAQRTDFNGILTNLKMCETKNICDFSKQTFYNSIYSLEKKGFIIIQKNREVDYDIILIDNKFKNEKDTTEPYMNLHFDFLDTKEFYNLSKNIKRLLLRIMAMKKNRIKMKKDKLKEYKIFYIIEDLKNYLDITQQKNGTYILSLKNKYRNKQNNLFFKSYYHRIKNMLIKSNLIYDTKDLKDAVTLAINNRKYYSIFLYALSEMKYYGFLSGKLLNTIISRKIKFSYN
jgi:hypothetical protein